MPPRLSVLVVDGYLTSLVCNVLARNARRRGAWYYLGAKLGKLLTSRDDAQTTRRMPERTTGRRRAHRQRFLKSGKGHASRSGPNVSSATATDYEWVQTVFVYMFMLNVSNIEDYGRKRKF